MKTKLISLALLVAIMAGFAFAPVSSVQAAPLAQVAAPVTGTFTDAVGGVGTFVGTFDVERFAVQNRQLVAIGTLTGTATDSLGNVVRAVTDLAVTLPVTSIQGTCDILHLELGPLDLNLLGLVVHLDRVVLDITAQQGGGLLGDLLCAIANLLDTNSPINAIARFLNNILRILG